MISRKKVEKVRRKRNARTHFCNCFCVKISLIIVI